ncbi:MAG TPA: hypothetical protein VGD83_30410 [Streptosporangiaceae bacterium]
MPQPELAQQLQVRVPGHGVQPTGSHAWNLRSCLSAAGSTPQLTSKSRK